jgi:DNA-directed RNA polymerase subunit alpha
MAATGEALDVKEILSAEDVTLDRLHEVRREIHCHVELRTQVEQLLADFDAVAKKLSSENKAQVRRGTLHWILGQDAEAIQILEPTRAARDRSYVLGLSYLEQGSPSKAVEPLKQALEGDPSDPLVSAACCEAKILSGSMEEAETHVDRLHKKKEPDAEAWYLKGLLADARGARDDAQAAYEKALEREPGHAKSLFRMAYMTDLRGEDARALELFEQLRKMRPMHLNTVMNLGVLYEDRGDYERAVQCYQSVLDYFPKHPRATLYLKDAQAAMTMFYDEDAARREAKLQQVLGQPVAEIAFSPRVRNALQKLNVVTLGDLVQRSEEEMLALPNFGRTSLREVKEFLSSKGLAITSGGGAIADVPEEAAAPEPGAPAGTEILQKNLADLEWSGRIRKVFEKLGVVTISDLLQRTEKDLLKSKNLGQTSIKEIRKKLGQYGLAMHPE